MRQFQVHNSYELFEMKNDILNNLKKMETQVHMLFGAVQNGDIIITADDLKDMSDALDRFGELYTSIDNQLLEYVEALVSDEIINEK